MNREEPSLGGAIVVIDQAPKTLELDDKSARRLGLLVVLALFGGIGVWSALAPLSSAALAPGLVTVESYRKTVQHMEGGIVSHIHVRDGDKVAKDQVLVTLDATHPKAQLEVLRGQYYISLAREARLLAQRTGRDKVEYPRELLQANDPRAKEAIHLQDQTFQARKLAHQGEAALYEQQIRELGTKAEGLRAQERSRGRLVGSYGGELEDFEALLKEGYAEKQKVRELERNLAQREGERGELQSQIAGTEVQINETRLKIIQLGKELQREVAKELSEVQADLFELREKQRSLQDTVQRMVVKAPEPGVVLGLATHTIGAVIAPGGKLLDIVPQNENLIVEAKVSLADIDRVTLGQEAEIRFSAFKSRSTPKIDGKVISVSADSFSDKEQQVSYYLARVQVTPTGQKHLAANNLALLPGMPAEVLINIGERTFLQYLIDPLRDTMARSFIED